MTNEEDKEGQELQNQETECVCCQEEAERPFTTEEGEKICETCWEEDLREPQATVVTNEEPNGLRIGNYRNETKEWLGEDHFVAEWHSTDAWRGYVSVEPRGDWQKVDQDQVLTMKNDKKLKEKYDRLKEIADEAGLEWALVSARTSNVFSNSAEFYVLGDPEKLEEVEKPVAEV